MGKEVELAVKAVKREEPDLRKLARALIQLAFDEQLEAPSSEIPDLPSGEAAS